MRPDGVKRNVRWDTGRSKVSPPRHDYCRPGTNEDDTTLAKEWNALNSGLLKQLFDRHYVLEVKNRGEGQRERRSMWLVPPLIRDPTLAGEMPLIKNTLALI